MGTHTQDVTVVGWVGSELRTYHLDGVGGVPYTQFRLASTRRVLDRSTGAFRDGPTLWFTVKAWRATAVNIADSLTKGDPVVVVGRLGQSEWVAQDGSPRTELVLEALSVGHDLSFGRTQFRRTLGGARRTREDLPDAAPRDQGLTDDPWASVQEPPEGGEPPVDEADVVVDEEAPEPAAGALATAGRG